VVHLRDVTLPLAAIAGERALASAANFRYPDFREVIRLMANGKINAAPMLMHVLPLEQAPEAFAIARDKAESGAVKVVLRP